MIARLDLGVLSFLPYAFGLVAFGFSLLALAAALVDYAGPSFWKRLVNLEAFSELWQRALERGSSVVFVMLLLFGSASVIVGLFVLFLGIPLSLFVL
jgi:hypothetical protein